MSILPRNVADKIAFCESHRTVWSLDPESLGTDAAAVEDLSDKTDAARAALLAQERAQQAAQAATLALHLALAAMSDSAADILKAIKAKAASSGDGIYSRAKIPVPAQPAPRPAPGTPSALRVTLDGSGALNLKWKCDNPKGTSGTIYQIWRRVGSMAAGEFSYIGRSGTKSFVDATLPAGATQVLYQIQAVRSTVAGPTAQFTVNFGAGASGPATASIATPSRAAA